MIWSSILIIQSDWIFYHWKIIHLLYFVGLLDFKISDGSYKSSSLYCSVLCTEGPELVLAEHRSPLGRLAFCPSNLQFQSPVTEISLPMALLPPNKFFKPPTIQFVLFRLFLHRVTTEQFLRRVSANIHDCCTLSNTIYFFLILCNL